MAKSKPDYSKWSSRDLSSEMWDAVVPAFFGSWVGVCLALYAVFWRLVLRPWEVLLDYGDCCGGKVWRTFAGHDLYDGPVPPAIPMWDNIWPTIALIVGISIVVIFSARWRAVGAELKRRRLAELDRKYN